MIDVDDTAGEGSAETITDSAGIPTFWRLNVSDEATINAVIEEVVEQFGKLDILINQRGDWAGQADAPGKD